MKTYIIAEIGPNHNGDLETALSMIDKLSKIGVDAVKFQLTIPESLFSLDSFKPKYQRKNVKNLTPIEMSKKYQLSTEQHKVLYKSCQNHGIDYLCSAFDIESLRFLDSEFNLSYFKIASGEIFSLDLLEYISNRKKPIILSTGMATYEEIDASIAYINRNFLKEITILHCISNYPVLYEEVNLSVMRELKNRFSYPVGFSDHTIGIECALASVAMGASVIEKHVTLDKSQSGPDHKASATIEEFHQLVTSVRNIEKAIGNSIKIFSNEEIEIRKSARKSIVANRDIRKSSVITEEDISFKRPGYGFSPLETNLILGKKASRLIHKNTVIKKEDLV